MSRGASKCSSSSRGTGSTGILGAGLPGTIMSGGRDWRGFSFQMKRDASFFGEGRAELVYIAKRLRDALRLESILTAAGVDYGVEADRYRGGFIFQTERVGAF